MSYQIDMHLKKNRSKGIAINGVPIRKASELFGVAEYGIFLTGGFKYYQKWSFRAQKIFRFGNLPAG